MTERFYSIKHLPTERLRSLFPSYKEYGWIDTQYYELMPNGIKAPEISDSKIILNIDAEHEHNYCVLMIDHEDEKDGLMIDFGLFYYEDFAAYLHLPLNILDQLVEEYKLYDAHESKDYTIPKFLMEQTKDYMTKILRNG